MSASLQICGLVAGVLSWCLQSSCTSSQLWKVRSQAESLSSSQWQFEGLWMSCAATSLGTLQCSKFKTLLGLPVHVQACRALMLSSLVVGLASIIVAILGLKCSRVGGSSEQAKGQFTLSGGVMLILSGVTTLIAVSWYAGRVISDFYNPLYNGVRFELGTGLYLGWAASGLAFLGGAMLCCSYRRSSSPPERHFSYNYSKSSQSHNMNIYKAAHVLDDGGGSAKAYV
ncbi:claudin-7-like isoform X1 [Corythoichthys intestinalis]|uniref:claudin-7-like isoform X1 n=1 Tax=Corythoichthys intestinalis TaxID=161448 RepID=UPI0025A53081|nr:claudin-7-like isoform X1 [Corythoichthys intestinalis]